MLFKVEETKNTLPELTAEIAQGIYTEAKKGKDQTQIFLSNDYLNEHIIEVFNEIKRLEKEILSKVSGSYLIEKRYPATYKEDGTIDEEAVPAVYFDASTKTVLLESLSSDLLDVSVVLDDVIKYNPSYNESRTWTEFKQNYERS